MPAPISPGVPLTAVAQVAGVRVLNDQVVECLTSQCLTERPGLRLGQPHQGGFDGHGAVQTQADRHLQGLERVVAAVGVAGVIGLAHATHQHRSATAVGQRGREVQEQQVAAGHEGVGQPVGLHFDGARFGQRGVRDLAQQTQVEQVVFAQARRPIGEGLRQFGADAATAIELDLVPLTIVKTDGFDVAVARQGPGQTGGGVLSSRENDQCGAWIL